jgi:uncharacterized protein (TIGR02646 family)
MIRVHRGGCPASLLKHKAGWDTKLASARISGIKNDIRKVEGNYAQTDVKDALEALFNGKCAYCESEINSVSYTHIEHYRPKSKYHTLCFEWTNLLLACARCNSKAHKGDLFPEAAERGPLLDPSAEEPRDHLKFIYDSTAKLALVEPRTDRGTTTARLFGLNTRKALLKRRTNFVRRVLALKVLAGTDADALELLADATSPSSEYSAWAMSLL